MGKTVRKNDAWAELEEQPIPEELVLKHVPADEEHIVDDYDDDYDEGAHPPWLASVVDQAYAQRERRIEEERYRIRTLSQAIRSDEQMVAMARAVDALEDNDNWGSRALGTMQMERLAQDLLISLGYVRFVDVWQGWTRETRR